MNNLMPVPVVDYQLIIRAFQALIDSGLIYRDRELERIANRLMSLDLCKPMTYIVAA